MVASARSGRTRSVGHPLANWRTVMASAHTSHLLGHVALVTGSNKGIGAAIARRLAVDGADVTITGRDAEAAQRSAQLIYNETGRQPLVVPGDIGDPAMIHELL